SFITEKFHGKPIYRLDPTVDFVWRGRAIPKRIQAAVFSVRWSGLVQPAYSEIYTFYLVSCSPARLSIEGRTIVDASGIQAIAETSGTIQLQGGQTYNIRIDCPRLMLGTITKLLWRSASTPKSVVHGTQLYPGRINKK